MLDLNLAVSLLDLGFDVLAGLVKSSNTKFSTLADVVQRCSGIGEDVRLILQTLLVHISRCKIEAKRRLAKYSRLLVEPYEIASACDMQLLVAELGKIFLLKSKEADQTGCIRL